MSSWSQAVWVVKKLQKNFDFNQQINYYVQNLNTLNGRVNALNDRIVEKESSINNFNTNLQSAKAEINTVNSTIRATSKNNSPNGYNNEQYAKGTIWLVLS